MRLSDMYSAAKRRLIFAICALIASLVLIIGFTSTTAHAETNEATAVHTAFGLEYAVPNGPRNLTAEAPGRIWYTATDAGGIGFLEVITDTSVSGVRYRTEFYGFGANSQPYDLVYDNGFVWFTLRGIRSLGKIDVVTREIEIFQLLSVGAAPTAIDADNAGRLWIGQNNGRISRFDPVTETFVEFLMPDFMALTPRIEDMVYQSDRAIWFTMPEGNRVVSYDTVRDRFFSEPTGMPPMGIDIDDAGAVWVTVPDEDFVGRRTITTVSTWVWYDAATPLGGPMGVTVFRDDIGGNQVWFSENKTGTVGRLQLYNIIEVANREKAGPSEPPGNTWGIINAPDQHIWVADTTRNVLYELAPPYFQRLYVAKLALSLPPN